MYLKLAQESGYEAAEARPDDKTIDANMKKRSSMRSGSSTAGRLDCTGQPPHAHAHAGPGRHDGAGVDGHGQRRPHWDVQPANGHGLP